MHKISVTREIPCIAEYDVLVCGGGPSGMIAAVAAARNGAKTALIERYGFLGGAATASLVNPISVFKKNGVQVIKGVPWEFVQKLTALGGARDDYESGNVPVDAEKFKLAAQRMVLEAGVKLYLHSYISDVVMEGKQISHVLIENKDGASAIAAKYFIDCTGDGDVCFRAGVPMQEMPPESGMQPASLGFRLGGVKLDQITGFHPAKPNTRHQMFKVREIFESLAGKEEIPNFGGPWFCTVMNDGMNMVSVNITRTAANAVDGESVTRTECKLREDVFRLFELLKKYVPAFSDSYLLTSAPQAGFRESRRIRGNYILTVDEYASAFHFEDAIARGGHPVDIHRATDSQQDVKFLNQAGYIPYRAMVAEAVDNIWAAGRCISADRPTFASTRVMATAMALGQAAGTAAALCLQEKCTASALDTKKLRAVLEAQGADI